MKQKPVIAVRSPAYYRCVRQWLREEAEKIRIAEELAAECSRGVVEPVRKPPDRLVVSC